MKKYKAGKIADILGVSIETVRNYEKMGLIHPERDQGNGYRLYDAVDVNVLRRARAYTGFGMTMRESADLIMHGSVANLAEAMDRCCEMTERQVYFELRLLAFAQHKRRHLSRIAGAENEVMIENCPAMLALIYRDGDVFLMDKAVRDTYRAWNDYHPFTEASLHYERDNFFTRDYRLYHGLMIEETYASALGITPSEVVKRFPVRRCLYTFASCPHEPQVSADAPLHAHLVEVMRSRGLTIAGDPFGRVLHTGGTQEGYRHYAELWVPIE